VSGPRRHRPTSLHRARPTALVAAVHRRRRHESGVRVGDGSGPLRPLEAGDPAEQRAVEAARRLLDAASGRQNR
jgi:hypothetical protein